VCLSRDFHLSDYQLTALLLHFVPDQLTDNFVIKPIPKEISSIIASLLLSLKPTTASLSPPTRSKLATGGAGKNFLSSLDSQMIHSSSNSQDHLSTDCLPPSPVLSETESLALKKAVLLHQEQSKLPWTTWRRPFETTTKMTQDTTAATERRLFFSAKRKATPTKTHPQNTRKH